MDNKELILKQIIMLVIKRNKTTEDFSELKIKKAIEKAFISCKQEETTGTLVDTIIQEIKDIKQDIIPIENIQNIVENNLMKFCHYKVAKAYILYREKHKQARFIKERIDYMEQYSNSSENAASSSETDANANISIKNVSNLEGEVYKGTNRIVQRQRMKNKLHLLYPEVEHQYEKDLQSHILYINDEATTPVLKPYCMAASLYPLLTTGVGNIDGVTASAPNDLQSFSGQITNLVFLLSSQVKGAVALGEYFIALNYYAIKDFGSNWYLKLDCISTSDICYNRRTIKDSIIKAFKQFVWGINQPAGNRGFQSPFTNISYYDHTYFTALFENFYYPDGTKPEWEAIDILQRLFLKWFNAIRLTQILTYPVESFCMVHDSKDIIDKEYKDLCATMYAEGHSFFTYISDSADSLASCCRLRNELAENTFSPTSGMSGIMTGSCNVMTLNINRITQLWKREKPEIPLSSYLTSILERVYKYQITYKTMLYELEEKKMFAACNGGYIHINKLYSTIGINGINEAAIFLGLTVDNNQDYIKFLQDILGTIKEQNKFHSIKHLRRPILFNSEVIPAESLGVKNYNWDKRDGFVVPEYENLYNSYFYNAHTNTSILDKLELHGRRTSLFCDGGSACHINLENHLSKQQYLKLIDIAIKKGTNYFTFNIPNSKCENCNFITKHPISTCPICNSTNITQYTRIIGYLRPISSFGKDRQIEAAKRVYTKESKITFEK